jgi:hypothetical protein
MHAASLEGQLEQGQLEQGQLEQGQLEQGQHGEQLVAPALELLRPQGFEVLHDVELPGRPRAGIDHVIVGGPGVFVMNTESWSGTVMVEAGTLWQKGYSRVQQTEAVHRAALFVGLSLGASWAALVVPVICLIGPSALVPTQAGPVTVLSLDHLTAWLMSHPSLLTPPGVAQISRCLRVALPGVDAVAGPTQPADRNRRSRRRAPGQVERRAVPRGDA